MNHFKKIYYMKQIHYEKIEQTIKRLYTKSLTIEIINTPPNNSVIHL